MMSFLLALAAQAAVASAPQAAVPTPFTNKDDAKIVCRYLIGTGSRIDTQRVCLPKREWQRMWEQGRETVSSLQDNQSKRPMEGR
jgi:hypothetical protein